MKNILILADGSMAKHFITWISRKRVAENKYYVISYKPDTLPEKMGKHITHMEMDPTSFAKFKNVMDDVRIFRYFYCDAE